jgi:hypothetical protein
MKWKINELRPHFLLGVFLGSIILPSSIFAANTPPISKLTATTHTPGYLEIIGAGSLSNVRAGNGSLGVTSSETDTLQQTNNNKWNSLGAQLGLGYVYFLGDATEYSTKTQWFPMFEPQVNVYFNKYENLGNVFRFGNSANNELTYNMPIYSTRLMLDGALTIVSYKESSAFVIAGIGNSWNRIGYKDYDGSGAPCTNQSVHLSNHSRSHFVWELGAGLYHK